MSLLQDFSASFKSLRKAPGFSLVVVLTLALGIGANTAVFSMIHVLLLEPLPYPDPGHLLMLFEAKNPNDSSTRGPVAPGNFLDWTEQTRAFENMAAICGFHYNLTGSAAPEHVMGGAVSSGYFRVLGIHASLGRDFRPEDDRSGANPTIILSDHLWRTRYQSDREIVGKAIGLNGDAFTVIGVMPPKADFHTYELWVPLQVQVRPDRMMWREARFLEVIARPKAGVTMTQAADDLIRIAASLRAAHPAGDILGAASIAPLQDQLRSSDRNMLRVSFATVLLVLLIACANVANLMLLRVTGRSRELAVRLALGARPGKLVRQLVAEGITLGCAAGVLGLAFGAVGKRVLLWQIGWQSPELAQVDLSLPVLAFTVAVSILAGIFFSLLPAISITRAETHDLLRTASHSSTLNVKGRRLRHGLVLAEIACSVVLLIGAGLLVRSFSALRHVPLGFASDHRVVVLISLPRIHYQRDLDVVRFYDQVGEKVRALPGVEDASFTYQLPLDGSGFGATFKTPQQNDQFYDVTLRLADSHLLSTLGVPLLHGRGISDSDRSASEPVCLISHAMALGYWPDQDPLGKTIILTRGDVNGEQRPRRIVGIVGDVRDRINEEPQPTVYVPYAQVSFPSMQLLVHTRDSAAIVRKSVAQVLNTVDPDQPIRHVGLLADSLPGALADWSTAITLLGSLAGVAVVLTILGIFAVIAYTVRERSREIGIRMAVGATPASIRNLVLRQTAWLATCGALIGMLLAAACTRFLGSLIYGIRSTDPLTFTLIFATIGAVALLAGYIPARRAMSVDPMLVLRQE